MNIDVAASGHDDIDRFMAEVKDTLAPFLIDEELTKFYLYRHPKVMNTKAS